MSAGPSGTEADMLTRARDPVDRSSKRVEIIIGKNCNFSRAVAQILKSR